MLTAEELLQLGHRRLEYFSSLQLAHLGAGPAITFLTLRLTYA